MRFDSRRFWIAVALASLSARADDIVWTRPPLQLPYATAYDWSNTNYWSPKQVPGVQDRALLSDASCQLVKPAEVGTVLAHNMEFFGPGPMFVRDLMVSGQSSFVDAAALNYTNYPVGRFRYDLLERAVFLGRATTSVKWFNFEEAFFTNATFIARQSMYNPPLSGASWTNTPGSHLLLVGSNIFTYASLQTPRVPFFNDVGAIVRKKSTNYSRIEWRLNGNGEVIVEEGLLEFLYPEAIDGPMTTLSNATLRFDSSGETVTIGPRATFNGDGRIEFYNYQYLSTPWPKVVNCAMALTNCNVFGEAMLFTRPAVWRNTSWSVPLHFMFGGNGAGTVNRSMVNQGVMTDAGISSEPMAVCINLPPGYYYASNGFSGSINYQGTNVHSFGWFTNTPLASLHFQSGTPLPTIRWNIHNAGYTRFDPGVRARLPGSFVQDGFGSTELSGNTISVFAHLVLEGQLSGWGGMTSHNVHVSGTISPHGSNSAFGRIELRTQNNTFTAFPTNRLTFTPNTVFNIDLGAPGTPNDYIYVIGPNQSLAATVNIRALPGFGPGNYPFFNTFAANLRFGVVPPGYRYSFATNASTGELSIVVSRPQVQTVSLHQSGGTGFELTLNTLSNANYTIDYTDRLGADPWQPWTNLVGNGGAMVLPINPAAPSRMFRVTEKR